MPRDLPVESRPHKFGQAGRGSIRSIKSPRGTRGSTGELAHTGRFINSLPSPFRGRFRVLGPTMVGAGMALESTYRNFHDAPVCADPVYTRVAANMRARDCHI